MSEPWVGEPEDDRVSFDELYAKSRVAMIRLASFLMASRVEGEELAQEVYDELFLQWDSVTNPATVLRTMVVQRCVRSLSTRRKERDVVEIDRGDDPYLSFDNKADTNVTLAAVRRLKPEKRVVVVLRYYTDMSQDQIAEGLGCSTTAARKRLHRALADLRKELG